jgi:hypothetical protein
VPGKLPAFQFYTGDWLKDPELSMCSPATRGIWADAICAMHEFDRSGSLTGTREQLSRVCRCALSDMQTAIAELDSTGAANVTERNGVVTLVNRRMQREHQERLATRNRVQRHRGNGRSPPDVTPPSSSSSSISSSEEEGLPKELDTPEFRRAWADYLAYRTANKMKTLKPASVRRQFATFAGWGVVKVVEAIDTTIRQGWQGIFEPSAKRDGASHKPNNGKSVTRMTVIGET